MSAPTGYTTVSASNLKDATGAAITNATIWFQPVDNNGKPLSFRSGGTQGTTIVDAVSTTVTNGAFSIVLADTTLTSPMNIGYTVTVVDNVTGEQRLGRGYECIQPSGATWNFDSYVPNLGDQVTVIVGGTGPAGPPLTPRGNYASGTTYAKGDVASANGGSYISLQDANVGHAPATSPGYWMLLASRGTDGVDGASGTVFESRVLRTQKVEHIQLRDDAVLFSDIGAGNVEKIQVQYSGPAGAGFTTETTRLEILIDGIKYTMTLGMFMLTFGYEDGSTSDDYFNTETLGAHRGTGLTFMRRVFIPYKYFCRIALTYVADTIPADWVTGTAYNPNARVQHSGYTWVSHSGDAAGLEPGVSGSWFKEYADLFTQVEYRHGAVPSGLYPATRNTFRMFNTTALRQSSVAMLSTLNLVSALAGPGELGALFLAIKSPTSRGASHLEGNPTITADGVDNIFGGTEDFFGGGWYSWALQRSPEWGQARVGLSGDGSNSYWGLYRHWNGQMRYPFSSSLSINWPVGQGDESASGYSIQAQGHVVAYTTAPYPAANTSAFPLCLDYTASSITGVADGGDVTSWPDAAGVGATALNQKTSGFGWAKYNASGINGHPTVKVDKGLGTGISSSTTPIPHPNSDGYERTWLMVIKNYLGAADFGSRVVAASGFWSGRMLVESDTDTLFLDYPNAKLTGVGQGVPIAVLMTTSNSREKRIAAITDGTQYASDALWGGADTSYGAYAPGLYVGIDANFGTATADIACIRCYEGAVDPETAKAMLHAACVEFGLS